MSRGGARGRGRGHRRGPRRDRKVELDRYRPIVPEWSRFLEAAARPEPTVLRVNTRRIRADDLRARLAAGGFELREIEGLPDFFRVEGGPRPLSMTLEHWLGLCYVQQASTGVAAPALGPEPGERVLDLCAAPGGKTTHVCQLMGDRGCVVASEISESRIRGLLGNVYRLGHTNVLVVSGDGRDFPEGPRFDRTLVDAPCSGEGTLRRRAGEAPDQSPSFLAYVTGAQRALLAKAVRVTRPGGVVLYVTCTFAPEENEAVVSEALRTLPVELEPLDLPVPHAPGLTAFGGLRFDPRVEGAARIYPHHLDSGGLFLARLRRLDGDEGTEEGRGWSSIPGLFPELAGEAGGPSVGAGPAGGAENGEDAGLPDAVGGVLDTAKRGMTDAEAEAQMAAGLAEVVERFGVPGDLSGLGWTMRGGRAWMHTAGEWPLEAWAPDRWRAVSLGLRAIEFDSRERPRPTNDFLRWAGAGRAIDLGEEEVLALLRREPVPTGCEERGPVALALAGDVIGRGAVTEEGLKSEVPRARAADLRRILERA